MGSIEAAEDELYGVPPDEFVGRRRAAASAAKQRGEPELADEISALRKPTAAASILNGFARGDTGAIDGLLAVGERLRDAVDRGDGDEIRELMRERTTAVSTAMRAVRDHASGAGRQLSAAVAAQIEQTFRAAMASPDDSHLLRRGVLSTALEEPAFGTPSDTASKRSPTPGRAPRRADAERRTSSAAAALDRAEHDLLAAAARRAELEAERESLRDRLDEVEGLLRQQRDQEAAAEAVAKGARADLRSARAELRRITSDMLDR